jgi:hypothetical protein
MAKWYEKVSDRFNPFDSDFYGKGGGWDTMFLGYGDEIAGAAGDYFMGDTRAAREQQKAARAAEGYVGEYGGQALNTTERMAARGMDDYDRYREGVETGQFQTDPIMTGQYQPTQFGQGPAFQQYNPGQDPGFQQFQRQQAPQYNAFQRQQGPEFQRADAGEFDFNYQESPGFQHQVDKALDAIGSRHSAQGSRFGAGRDKETIDYITGAAAQDFGNQYARARGAFEADRGFGAQQAGQENIFNQGRYQFGTGLDAQQQALANQAAMQNYQFGTGVDVGQQNLANQYGQNAFQFGANMGANQSNLANQANMQNYWNQQGMQQGENQFAFNANQAANLQNYNMLNQQQQQQAGLMGGLANQGYGSQVNLANMQMGQGEALANAALGVGNANANRALATQNTVNNAFNTLAQGAGAYKAIAG